MRVICCDCGHEYDGVLLQIPGVDVPVIQCPVCGLSHTVEFKAFKAETPKPKKIDKIKLGATYYAALGGSRILSVDGSTDHSGSDDNPVTGWDKADEFIVAVCIHSNSKNTEPSTYKLQIQDDTDASGYADLAGSGELIYTLSDSSWSHGDTVATGDQVCDIQGGDTRQAGERIKGQSLSDSIDLADEFQSELWFGINAANADDAHQYSFRLYSTAEGAAVGDLGATLTMAAGATTYYQNTGQGSTAITGSVAKVTKTPRGAGSIGPTGALTTALRKLQAVGGGSVSPTGDSANKALKQAGGGSMAITGSLARAIKITTGSGSVDPTGSLAKKMTKDVGAYSVTIAGSVDPVQKVGQNTGSGSVAITGTLTKKLTRAIGGYAVTIAGAVAKKMSEDVGGYSITITGSLVKKILRVIGEYAMTIAGSLTRKTAKDPGTHQMAITGSLGTNFIPGSGVEYQAAGGGSITMAGSLVKKISVSPGQGSVDPTGSETRLIQVSVGQATVAIVATVVALKSGNLYQQTVGGNKLSTDQAPVVYVDRGIEGTIEVIELNN